MDAAEFFQPQKRLRAALQAMKITPLSGLVSSGFCMLQHHNTL